MACMDFRPASVDEAKPDTKFVSSWTARVAIFNTVTRGLQATARVEFARIRMPLERLVFSGVRRAPFPSCGASFLRLVWLAWLDLASFWKPWVLQCRDLRQTSGELQIALFTKCNLQAHVLR